MRHKKVILRDEEYYDNLLNEHPAHHLIDGIALGESRYTKTCHNKKLLSEKELHAILNYRMNHDAHSTTHYNTRYGRMKKSAEFVVGLMKDPGVCTGCIYEYMPDSYDGGCLYPSTFKDWLAEHPERIENNRPMFKDLIS